MASTSANGEALSLWHEGEALAERMVPLVGALYRDRDVVLSIYGRSLVRQSAIGIVKAHRYARQVIDRELLVTDSFPIIAALTELDLDSARLGSATYRLGSVRLGSAWPSARLGSARLSALLGFQQTLVRHFCLTKTIKMCRFSNKLLTSSNKMKTPI